MPEDLKLSQIGSSQLPLPFRGLHSPGVKKHCQMIFACYFRKSSIQSMHRFFRILLPQINTQKTHQTRQTIANQGKVLHDIWS